MPLDNFISRGTEVFVTSTNPNYLQSVHAMAKARAAAAAAAALGGGGGRPYVWGRPAPRLP